jgi:hypothetical protein
MHAGALTLIGAATQVGKTLLFLKQRQQKDFYSRCLHTRGRLVLQAKWTLHWQLCEYFESSKTNGAVSQMA